MLCASLFTLKVNPKSKGIFILDKEYAFPKSVSLLARAILTIVEEDEAAVFSIADILCLLRSINAHVPGEFEIQHTHSHYYKIVYKSEDEVIESFRERWEGFIE